MRRFTKIMKWTALVLVLLAGALTATVMSRQDLSWDRPYPAIAASADSAVIHKGRNFVLGAGHCAGCHSLANADSLLALGIEPSLSGGRFFDLPFGKIYASNITPDRETGIGKFTDAEMARSLRYGVHPDGTLVFNFMPYHNMSDEDLRAVISYLRAQPAVPNEVPGHSLNTLGKTVKAFLIKPVGPSGEVPWSVKPDTTPDYGRYIAGSIANCGGCHTKSDMASGDLLGEPYAGGMDIEGFITPNITPDRSSRIYGWSQQQFLDRFRMGRKTAGSPMPWESFRRMSDLELKAVYNYLQTIPPAKLPSE